MISFIWIQSGGAPGNREDPGFYFIWVLWILWVGGWRKEKIRKQYYFIVFHCLFLTFYVLTSYYLLTITITNWTTLWQYNLKRHTGLAFMELSQNQVSKHNLAFIFRNSEFVSNLTLIALYILACLASLPLSLVSDIHLRQKMPKCVFSGIVKIIQPTYLILFNWHKVHHYCFHFPNNHTEPEDAWGGKARCWNNLYPHVIARKTAARGPHNHSLAETQSTKIFSFG